MRAGVFFLLFLFFASLGSLSAQTPSQNTNPTYWFERGRDFMFREDWYSAVESFLECIRINPAHAEAAAALADSYYELAEFDQALTWIRRARQLSRGSMALANMEAFVLIALGSLDEASRIIDEVLLREPNNREAQFAAAELDIARGRTGDAISRYRETAQRFPDDRRLLVSLALSLGSLGNTAAAASYIERALVVHPDDFRVHYYASYLAAKENRISNALEHAENALYYRPGYRPALSLLASLRYRSGDFRTAVRLADDLINSNRDDVHAWYLKGISNMRLGNNTEAINALSSALAIAGNNEFVRYTLSELLISSVRLEDPRRSRWAVWHFNRARDFHSKNLMEQALFEYRRGLRLDPYASARLEYANLLRIQGYPARYLEELRFMQAIGLEHLDIRTVRALNDAVETYNSLLSQALFRRWNIDPIDVTKPHWNVAVFSLAGQSTFFHTDAGAVASSFIREIMVHERNIFPMEIDQRQVSYSQALRQAREREADYFLIVSVTENERDITIKGELFVARTGSPAAVFNVFRTGEDRLRDACWDIVRKLSGALPFRAEMISRSHGQGLIDKGRADGVRDGDEFILVRKGRVSIKNEGIGLVYAESDITGKITVTRADEEVSAGNLERNGFFDRIVQGDEVLKLPEEAGGGITNNSALFVDPELSALLRTLRW